MTVTLTTEELSNFASDLEKWNRECLHYILTHYSPRALEARPTDQLLSLKHKYEREHPRPDWRSLL